MDRVLSDIFLALWFFLPAAIANVTPIFIAQVKSLKKYDAPMDFGKTFRGHRIFGAHKTWRGFIAGTIFAILTLWIEQLLVAHIGWLRHLTAQIDYDTLPTLLVGTLFGIGALGGDAIESFFKRQVGIAPGRGWFPFDQTDYIIGAALTTAPFVSLSFWQYVWLLTLWFIVHIISTVIGYLIGVKERPI